jgi:hypothetical protein
MKQAKYQVKELTVELKLVAVGLSAVCELSVRRTFKCYS